MNAYCPPVRNIVLSICAAVFLCSPAGVSAQPVYKQIDAAGGITFSDRPDTTPSPKKVPALDVVSALARNSPMSSRGAAIIDANEATRRLGQAELERKQGAERLPGEQAPGTDTSVADDRYRQRQDELRRAVIYAQRRSDKTDRALR